MARGAAARNLSSAITSQMCDRSWKDRIYKNIKNTSILVDSQLRWSFSSVASMSDHLKTCSFYQREERTEPVVLAFLREVREKHGEVKQQR
ncbi:unnamed protein product [Pleuronectes platessa]|uniref:F-box domain-containing protein n=1 Tax=Pleuronectes platessa TaxID=8262 RepID=A0A9N7TH93_PLEPL|nr:unnamed protein product [Pleuronectes platessa]